MHINSVWWLFCHKHTIFDLGLFVRILSSVRAWAVHPHWTRLSLDETVCMWIGQSVTSCFMAKAENPSMILVQRLLFVSTENAYCFISTGCTLKWLKCTQSCTLEHAIKSTSSKPLLSPSPNTESGWWRMEITDIQMCGVCIDAHHRHPENESVLRPTIGNIYIQKYSQQARARLLSMCGQTLSTTNWWHCLGIELVVLLIARWNGNRRVFDEWVVVQPERDMHKRVVNYVCLAARLWNDKKTRVCLINMWINYVWECCAEYLAKTITCLW